MLQHRFRSGLALYAALHLGVAAGDAHREPLVLASPDRPPATLVVPPASGQAVRFAGQELRKYVARITGVQLPLADDIETVAGPKILLLSATLPAAREEETVPASVAPPAGSDAFRIHTRDDTLLIVGGNDRAVLFGVYDLLERWDCRWLGPLEEHVPRRASIAIGPLDLFQQPAFRWRGLELIAGSNPAVVDWMAKAKLNVAWPEGYLPSRDLTADPAQMESLGIPDMMERGMAVFWGGHILPLLFSPERYADHPEYFAQIDGRRLDPDVAPQSRWQLCTGHPDVMRILTENTILFLRHHPWIDVLFIWANDTTQWCECDRCRALEPDPDRPSPFGGFDRSATYCRMIRIISEGVRRALPGRRIAFNHYYNLEDIPTDTRGDVLEAVLPPPTVLSAVDAYRQCDRHPFDDPGCPKGKRIEPLARMWNAHYPDTVSWSYYWSWNFMKGLPLSMAHKIPRDFRLLRSLGIDGMIDNVSLAPANLLWLNNRINFHLYGKAAWDPDLDVEAVRSDFIDHYYGPAARPMAAFWRLMDDATTRFGLDPEFMPEDDGLAAPAVVHGWLMDIRYLIPNRRVFDRAMEALDEALARVAAAGGEPLQAGGLPYVFRVQAVRSAIASWAPPAHDHQVFGFFNGGGHLSDHLYTGEGGIHGEIACTVASGNNRGDCFWARPLGREQLARPGDYVQVEAAIHVGTDTVGEPMYRSGPGLYQAHDQTSPCGAGDATNLMFFISNLDDDQSGARRVIALQCDGGYQTDVRSSADHVWAYGQPVTLRIDCIDDTAGQHTYRYSFNTGTGWMEVGTFSFSVRLPFVAPMHKWGGYFYGARTRYPVMRWATLDHFEWGSTPARP